MDKRILPLMVQGNSSEADLDVETTTADDYQNKFVLCKIKLENRIANVAPPENPQIKRKFKLPKIA